MSDPRAEPASIGPYRCATCLRTDWFTSIVYWKELSLCDDCLARLDGSPVAREGQDAASPTPTCSVCSRTALSFSTTHGANEDYDDQHYLCMSCAHIYNEGNAFLPPPAEIAAKFAALAETARSILWNDASYRQHESALALLRAALREVPTTESWVAELLRLLRASTDPDRTVALARLLCDWAGPRPRLRGAIARIVTEALAMAADAKAGVESRWAPFDDARPLAAVAQSMATDIDERTSPATAQAVRRWADRLVVALSSAETLSLAFGRGGESAGADTVAGTRCGRAPPTPTARRAARAGRTR